MQAGRENPQDVLGSVVGRDQDHRTQRGVSRDQDFHRAHQAMGRVNPKQSEPKKGAGNGPRVPSAYA
ncbi:hypothetical protein BASA81_014793 [Batrachochytrium salamandrivorans]|nr:hypothetical protein BASA62_002095 [Batrachochytrium salamandrivorans]KAH9247614.1 hypothetical protein BASA81_014793 [Batrachochytrium salamandrivorans]